MKQTLFCVYVFLCAMHLVAADSISIKNSTVSGNKVSPEYLAKLHAFLCSSDVEKRREGVNLLSSKGNDHIHLVDGSRNYLEYHGTLASSIGSMTTDAFRNLDRGIFFYVGSAYFQLCQYAIREHAPYIVVGRLSMPSAAEWKDMLILPPKLATFYGISDRNMDNFKEWFLEERTLSMQKHKEQGLPDEENLSKQAKNISEINHDGLIQIISHHPQGGSVRINVECLPE